ncbi:MAG: hypothetical protein ACR2M1_03985 [Gemmatimonadaceae bacterium]
MGSHILGPVNVAWKQGTERFHRSQSLLDFRVDDFWKWSGADLLSNTMRGLVAEFLVACDLGVTDQPRVEWNAFDLMTREGAKVEVKSAAYLQSWWQDRHSDIRFGIASTKGWNRETNKSDEMSMRQADVYVFALLATKDKARVDPLDVEQWEFYILLTETLNSAIPDQRTIGLTTLRRLDAKRAAFGGIANVIESLAPKGEASTSQ